MSRSSRFGRIAAASAALAVAVAGAAGAGEGGERPWPRHRRGPPPIERVLEKHAERLQLSEQTRSEIRRVADESRDETDAHRERLRELHGEMREILRRDTPDEDAVMRKADEIGAAETAEQKHRLRNMLEIRALLTPAQRAELVKIYEERRAQWRRDR